VDELVLVVNGKEVDLKVRADNGEAKEGNEAKESKEITLQNLLVRLEVNYDVMLVNGFAAGKDQLLSAGDVVTLIQKGVLPPESELEALMCGRHTPKVHEVFKHAKVGIAGLGGLGSNIAIALARVGIGTLILVDFDVVEPSNLNRQAYYIEDLGKKKCEALVKHLTRINPYNTYVGIDQKIEKEEVLGLFEGCDIIVEAFDDPKYKAMLVNEVLSHMKVPIVGASGLAGLYNPNTIVTKKAFGNLYITGDGIHEARAYEGLMAPRVMIAAGHQATTVCQLLLGQVDL
jgi:sulfur carrier protein ThiS adenylyltransferase